MSGEDASTAGVSSAGPLARLAHWSTRNRQRVAVGWLVLVIGLGVFLPRLEGALAGAGLEASGSQSVAARNAIQAADPLFSSAALSVVVTGPQAFGKDRGFRAAAARVARVLAGDRDVREVAGPARTGLISRNGQTVIVTGGAGADTSVMTAAADRLRDRVSAAAGPRYHAYMSGLSAQWADFNKDNREAALHSEAFALPITLTVLAIAFGSLVAAGLPLLITLIGLCVTGGVLFLLTRVGYVSIWAVTFTLIFTMALGIDYALFIVMRFREALREHADPVDSVAATMDTAGRAVAFSGTTVLVATAPCFLIPSPMPRSIALAITLSVCLVLSVVFTLMPMLLAWLGPRIDAGLMPWRQPGRVRQTGPGRMARWGEFIWKRPWPLVGVVVAVLVLLALPVARLRLGVPSLRVEPTNAPSRQGAEIGGSVDDRR